MIGAVAVLRFSASDDFYFALCKCVHIIIMAALRSRCGHYIFALWFLSIFFFILRLILAAADWMSTILPHMVWP